MGIGHLAINRPVFAMVHDPCRRETFHAVAEDRPGPIRRQQFHAVWPAVRDWYLKDGLAARPTPAEARATLQRHMPEIVEIYDQLCRLAGDDEVAHRALSGHDFREGVRAALVDKDRRPKWEPSSLAGVGDLEHFFAALGDEDLF